MAVDFHISVFGEEQAARSILRPAEHVAHPQPLWFSLTEDFVQLEEEQFDSQGTFSGGWAPLADSTISQKAAAGLDPRILHATLKLRESLTRMEAEGAVRIMTEDYMVFGSSIHYGKIHQTGAPAANIPQRRPVELSTAHRVQMVKKVQRFIFTGEVGAL